jgi:hypothetical protein
MRISTLFAVLHGALTKSALVALAARLNLLSLNWLFALIKYSMRE